VSAVPSGLPVLVFDEASIPAEYQFEVFHDTTAPLFDTRPLRPVASVHASAIDYRVDDLLVSRLRYGPQLLRRTPRHTAVAGDCVAVQLYFRGGLRGRIGKDITLDLDPRHIAIVDLACPFASWTDDSEVIWVTIPRAHFATVLPSRRVGVVRFHRQSPRGRTLTAAVEHLWADVVTAPASHAGVLAAGIIDAVRAVLRPGDFEPDGRSLALAIKDHIAANLDDLTLGPESLRATFYCSRSTIYRLFQADGGIAAYIREHRLLRCFDELAKPLGADATVGRIATRWGFENPSHFNRLFKAKFGLRPSALARSAGAAAVPAASRRALAQIAEFHAWAGSL
jgi:AraC-like DNA-binding protein